MNSNGVVELSHEINEEDILCVDCCQTPVHCEDIDEFKTICIGCLTDFIICKVLWNKSLRSKSTNLIIKQEKSSINKALEEYEIAPLDL